jgi:hypothetical protein
MNCLNATLIASSLLLVLGCSSEPPGSAAGGAGGTTGTTSTTGTGGASSTTGSGPSCAGAIGQIDTPNTEFCAESATFGDIYLDDSGKPLASMVMISDAKDSCAWFNSQPNKPTDLSFVKVEVFGPVPGTCSIYPTTGHPQPPFATCVAVVRSIKVKDGKEFNLRATSGSVEVTAASAASLTAKVSVSFPKEPYYVTECKGPALGELTCDCIDGLGHSKQCLTKDPDEHACCNEGAPEAAQVVLSATAPKCPEICYCATSVNNCPCL